jgi:hypothetical protein
MIIFYVYFVQFVQNEITPKKKKKGESELKKSKHNISSF